MSVVQLLSSSGYVVLNKKLLLELGVDEALMIGELASEQSYWEQAGKLDNGFFFSTIDNVQSNTGMSEYRQRSCLKRLSEADFLEVKIMGSPPKRYIKLNEKSILKFFGIQILKNSGIKTEKSQELKPKNFEGNNNNSKNNNNNNKRVCGRYKNVLLTDSEIKELEQYPKGIEYIERLSISMYEHNKSYKDHFGRILLWLKQDGIEKSKVSYNLAEWENKNAKLPEYKKKK